MVKPVRIQRSRKKGSRLTSPNGLPVVCVSRGTKWGNLYRADSYKQSTHYLDGEPKTEFIPVARWKVLQKHMAVNDFEWALKAGSLAFSVDDVRRELAGKNLACWCGSSDRCHADVLLELANAAPADGEGM